MPSISATAGRRLARLLGALVLAVTTTAPALAAPLELDFSGSGITTLTGNTGGVNGLELSVSDAPYTFTPKGGVAETDWLLDSVFVVNGLALGMPGTAFGQATFSNSQGDSVTLDFDGMPIGGGAGFVVMRLDYDVVGGSGRFAAMDGSGFEDVTIFLGQGPSFNFTGQGSLFLPEPQGIALVLAGLLALGLWRPVRRTA